MDFHIFNIQPPTSGFAIQPCALLGPGEAALATVDMYVLGGPIRCRRCKAYINPHVKFVDGGRKFVCNLCNVDTEVPPEYFCNLDHTGRRADTMERPELSRGSYEFLTTTDYCKGSKVPQSAAYIFVIDVTYASFQSGMVQVRSYSVYSNTSCFVLNSPPPPHSCCGFITNSHKALMLNSPVSGSVYCTVMVQVCIFYVHHVLETLHYIVILL